MKLLELIMAMLFHCLKVGRAFGIDIRIHWSFWALPLFVAFAMLPLGVLTAALWVILFLIFYICVVLHEYGHALTARKYGVSTRDIILTPLGGIARLERMPEKPMQEIAIALAGPAVNVVLGIILSSVLLMRFPEVLTWSHFMAWKDRPIITGAGDFMLALLWANIGMVGLNMLPAFPSDGGRVLRAFLALFLDRLPATQVAVYIGAFVALCLAIIGLAFQVPQLQFIAVLFAGIGQMELWMMRRQVEMEGSIWAESYRLPEEDQRVLQPPEANFSGYSWDAGGKMWVEWRGGVAVRKCRTRGW